MNKNTLLKKIGSMIQAESLQACMDIAFEILGNPCFVVDMSQNILAYSDVDVSDPLWEEIVLKRKMSRSFIDSDLQVLSEHAAAFNTEKALVFRPEFSSFEQIKKALSCNGEKLGLFMSIGDRHPFTKEDIDNATLIGDMIAYKMLSHVGFVHLQSVQMNTFFSSLINGTSYDPEQLKIRLKMFGLAERPYYYACVLRGSEEQIDPVTDMHLPLRFELFADVLNGISFMYHYSVVVVVPSDIPNNEQLFQNPKLLKLLQTYHLTAGISTCFRDITHLKIFYKQAETALRIGKTIYPDNQILFFDQLVLFDLIEHIPSETRSNYIHPDIALLHRHDTEHGTKLCETLSLYLENNRSLSKTAEIMFLHKNTVNYRINQCREILKTDFHEEKKLFIYIFSLAIIRYLYQFSD